MICVYPGCDRTDRGSRDLCGLHYHRWKDNPDTFPFGVRPHRDEPTGPYCTCEVPHLRPVVLFGMTMTDVHECGRCFRSPRPMETT